jgi:hypothetical protein
LAENGASPPYTYNPSAGSWTHAVGFALAGAFSVNLSNTPYQVDFPLDGQGNLVSSTFARWLDEGPCRLAKQLPPPVELAVYFDCGNVDPSGVHPWNVAFADSLQALGIQHEFRSYAGGHMNQLDSRYQIALPFLSDAMNQTTDVEDEPGGEPKTFLLQQNYPNPFNPSTTIEFTLPEASSVSLTVHNVIGQELYTLVEGKLPVGRFTKRWNAAGLPSGTYVYRLRAGEFQSTKTMLLVK